VIKPTDPSFAMVGGKQGEKKKGGIRAGKTTNRNGGRDVREKKGEGEGGKEI